MVARSRFAPFYAFLGSVLLLAACDQTQAPVEPVSNGELTSMSSQVVYSQWDGRIQGKSTIVHPGVMAENFTVPTGESWTFDQVEFIADFSGDAFTLSIYADDDGEPGMELHAWSDLPFAEIPIPRPDDPLLEGFVDRYTVDLPAAVTLTPGTYWLGVHLSEAREFWWETFRYVEGPGIYESEDGVTWSPPVDPSDSGSFLLLMSEPLNTSPDCEAAEPSTHEIWPPNNTRFEAIQIQGVTDPDGDDVSITIDSIYQDEAVDSRGNGRFAPDGLGVGTSSASVRAERDQPGNGRVYHVAFTADDGNGGTCVGEVMVSVPRNHGAKGAAVDDGALHDSTQR